MITVRIYTRTTKTEALSISPQMSASFELPGPVQFMILNKARKPIWIKVIEKKRKSKKCLSSWRRN